MPIYIVMVLGYSVFQAGLIWGVQIFVTILAKPLMGRVSDKHGRKHLLFWGMFVCATGPILAGLLIGLSHGQDFRLAFASIAVILIFYALFFRRTIPASA